MSPLCQVKTVFVDGIPASWDEDRVKGYLKEFGEIEKIELARNMPNAKRKDFGFVTFDTHDSAVRCADGINNQELGEGNSKVGRITTVIVSFMSGVLIDFQAMCLASCLLFLPG